MAQTGIAETIRLDGKVALITGGGAGIGAAVGQAMVAAGAKVMLADLDEDGLSKTAAALGDSAATIATDVSDEASMNAAVAATLERFGGLDIAVLNAGIEGRVASITDYPVDMFDKVIAVNLRGVFLGLRACAKPIADRGGGSIILMSSVAGVQGTPGFCAYTASKHAVVGLMKCAALEFAPMNIRVNTVNPGPIETRMMRSIEEGLSPEDSETVHAGLAESIPLKRYGSAEEVARMTLFLACDAASYSTGATYMVDGGMTAGRSVT